MSDDTPCQTSVNCSSALFIASKSSRWGPVLDLPDGVFELLLLVVADNVLVLLHQLSNYWMRG